ncbi:hypothetical protein [Erwinia phage Gungnir39]|nr:hypothetical protein [Erwinia phage Gungnir39]
MIVFAIVYFLIGASAFFIFHRYIRGGEYDVDDHFIGLIIFFMWPLAAFCSGVAAAFMGIAWLGDKIKGIKNEL